MILDIVKEGKFIMLRLMVNLLNFSQMVRLIMGIILMKF